MPCLRCSRTRSTCESRVYHPRNLSAQSRYSRYGGIFEKGPKEYTLDDFYLLQLDKLDRFTCLKKSDIMIPVGEEESSSDEEDDDDGDDGSDDDDDDDDDGDDKVIGEKVDVGDDEENQVNQRNMSRRIIPVEKAEEALETQNGEEDASGMKAPVSSLSVWKVSILDNAMLGLNLFSNECIHGCFDEYDTLD